MAQESTTIDKYTLARMTNFSEVRAVIWLYSGEQAFARLAFHAANVPTQLQVQQYGSNQVLWVFYPIEAYPDVVDILRNEAPVSLVYEVNTGYARVVTGKEPAGEGEAAT